MMRRLSRRRRTNASDEAKRRGAPIDASRWFERLRSETHFDFASLELLERADVGAELAACGCGERADGSPFRLAFSPLDAGDALLAALCLGAPEAGQEEFAGEVMAVAPSWSVAARRRLALVRAQLPFRLRALAAPALLQADERVDPEPAVEPASLTISQVVAQLEDAETRSLFERAARALEGLAAKHGGGVVAQGCSLEVTLLARRVAMLRAEQEGVVLTTFVPQRSRVVLRADELGACFDSLEGQLRKRLNDRRLREGEEGIRTRAIPLLATALSLRASRVWPLGGGERVVLDLLGVDPQGEPVLAAARGRFGLKELGTVLDAVQSIRSSLPALLEDARAPLRLSGAPRLVLAAEQWEPGLDAALAGLALSHSAFDIERDRSVGLTLRERGSQGAVPAISERVSRPGPGRRGRRGRTATDESAPEAPERSGETTETEAEVAAETSAAQRGRSRRRKRGRSRRDSAPERAAESATAPSDESAYEEVSLFDLEQDTSVTPDNERAGSNSRRRRGSGRRRRRESASAASEEAGDAETATQSEASNEPGSGGRSRRSRRRGSRRRQGRAESAAEEASSEEDETLEVVDDLEEQLVEVDDLFGLEASLETDADEGDAEPAVAEEPAALTEVAAVAEVAVRTRPRRRALIVAHADPDSLAAAVVLARDVRLIEGVRVYPQAELMNFFRGLATDLREDVPIHLVGFQPSPARDVIQAASLYRGRLDWYDHHDWPPEDRQALVEALAEECVHQFPGCGSSMPAVLETCTRRSRFTDKFVDLVTGRFSVHDYERWGRLWTWRLARIAGKSGDVRAEIDALLAGRPSELAREAAEVEMPPLPPELEFVSTRDFRLVHFAGYTMIVVETRPDLDPALTARIARDRYEAELSIAHHEGSGLLLFGDSEGKGRHALDTGALANHLAAKLEWVDALADVDRVARIRIRDFESHSQRLEEVIDEIAMARSVLER